MTERSSLRVSDEERDEVVDLLRGHLLTGRLDPEELEERVAEACSAKYGRDLEHALRELPRAPVPTPPAPLAPPTFVRPPRDSRPGTSLALGITGITVLLFTATLGAMVALPFSALAWIIGARAASRPPGTVGLTGRDTARTGMWLGVVGTLISIMALVVVALVFAG